MAWMEKKALKVEVSNAYRLAQIPRMRSHGRWKATTKVPSAFDVDTSLMHIDCIALSSLRVVIPDSAVSPLQAQKALGIAAAALLFLFSKQGLESMVT